MDPEEIDCFREAGRDAGDIGSPDGFVAFLALEADGARLPFFVVFVLFTLAPGTSFGFEAP